MAAPGPETVPLGEAAYRQLRADIVSCRLAPGQRLTERGLAARTGFGVAAIRDALTRLDHESLVRTLPRKGYQVEPLTIKTVDDLFNFWAVIGPELVRLGIAGATAEELERAAAGFNEIRRLYNQSGLPREIALQSALLAGKVFSIFAEATRNEYFISAFTRVNGELSRVWTLVADSELLQTGGPTAELDLWPDALSQRDGEAAAGFTRRYIEEAHNRVLRTLARWPSVITTEVVPLGNAPEA